MAAIRGLSIGIDGIIYSESELIQLIELGERFKAIQNIVMTSRQRGNSTEIMHAVARNPEIIVMVKTRVQAKEFQSRFNELYPDLNININFGFDVSDLRGNRKGPVLFDLYYFS